jgi:prepilin-type N-terminal cleavage/methylation domain-containing protein/prepilin-type processing-associated H-X9-DG protein
MGRGRKTRSAFSLVELLVVLGVIALLIAILIPVLGRARESARSTACLANVQQWGQAFQMYLNDNSNGRPMPAWTSSDLTTLRWWEMLSPYHERVQAALLCPDAAVASDESPDPGNGVRRTYVPGSASTAWRAPTYDVAAPQWVLRGDWRGSYGINTWVFSRSKPGPDTIRFPARSPERVPMLADACDPLVQPQNDDPVPKNTANPKEETGMARYCIARHAAAVNCVFLDGHAERIPLAELWSLKWSERSTPRRVAVPTP